MKKQMRDINEVFEVSGLFSSLHDEEKSFLVQAGSMRSFAKQESIFTEDSPAEGFYLLVCGLASVFHLTADGREIILHLVRPGSTLGESAVFQRGTFPASALALEDSQAVFFPAEAILRITRQNSGFAEAMLGVLALRVRLLTRKLEAQGSREAPERLAAYLAHRFLLGKQNKVVHLELPREALAQMLGIARETLSRAMAGLARKGIIKVNGRDVEIVDYAALEHFTNDMSKML